MPDRYLADEASSPADMKAPTLMRASSFDNARVNTGSAGSPAGASRQQPARSRSPPLGFCDRCARLHQSGGALASDASVNCPCACHAAATATASAVQPAWLGQPNKHSALLAEEMREFVARMTKDADKLKPAVSEAAHRVGELVRGLFARAKVETYGALRILRFA